MRLNKLFKKGFTLVELVVVIAVIAILAAVSVGAYFGVTESAKASKLQSESKQLHDNVLLVANTISDNHKIDSTGLYINDLEVFEEDLEKMSGISYEVYEGEVSTVVGNAIVFKKAVTSNAFNETPYVTFQYFTPEVQGSAGSVNVVTGDYEKVTSNVVIENLVKTTSELLAAVENANSHDAQEATLIKLGANIEVEDHLLISGKKVILDLNKFDIKANFVNGITHYDVNYLRHDTITIHAIKQAKVTITGNGSVSMGTTCDENCDINKDYHGTTLVGCYESAVVTIENGDFVDEFAGSILYTKGSGKTYIKGGTFNAVTAFKGHHYTLNTNNAAHVENHKEFEISGGTFYHDNPSAWNHNKTADMPQEGWNFLAEGYAVQESVENNDNSIKIYTVVKA